jgi:tetratricopeptide (TPR) repeat protein
VTPRQRLLGQSALQAFRSDIIPGAVEPTQADHSAILVATLLRQSLATGDESESSRIREKAVEIARSALGDHALNEGCTYDEHPSRSQSDVIRLVAQQSDHAGRLHLAQHLLESIAEIETDPLEAGRILSDRAKVTRKLGHLDLALEQNHTLMRTGKLLRSAELIAKAHFGLSALAETRGNYVEYRSRVRQSIRIARLRGLRRLYAASLAGLGKSHAMAGQFGEAVATLWRAYELVGGHGYIARAVLGNLGQTLLISGRPAEARKVAAIVIQGSQLGTVAPTLGLFALASAQVGDQDTVKWCANQIDRFRVGRGHAREIAEALMECSAALDAIGEKTWALVMRRRSETMATQFGFHSLTFREALQSVQRISEPPRFSPAATRATAAIGQLEAPRVSELDAVLSA